MSLNDFLADYVDLEPFAKEVDIPALSAAGSISLTGCPTRG